MKIERKDGYIIFEVVNRDCDKMEYAQAYNFTRNIFGYGDDMRDWENAGDLWGQIDDIDQIECMYSIAMAEEQFTAKELGEIYGCTTQDKNKVNSAMQQYATDFVEKFDLTDPHRQIICIEEEFVEFEAAHHFNREKENEEMADLVITCYIYAKICGYDLDAEIDRKMKINLDKTGKDETGKVK